MTEMRVRWWSSVFLGLILGFLLSHILQSI